MSANPTQREGDRHYIDRKLAWVDISTEKWRKYQWLDGNGHVTKEVVIMDPIKLNVSNNGHRVESADRHGHYIPYGWQHLEWEAKEEAPVFVY